MALEKREKTLLMAMIGLLVLFGGLFGYTQYKASMQNLRTNLAQLKVDAEVAKKSVQKDADLAEEKDWLAENEPPEMEYEDLCTQIKADVLKCLNRCGIGASNVMPRVFKQDDEMLNYRRVRCRFVVKTNEAMLEDLLVLLHSPKDSRAVVKVQVNRSKGAVGELLTDILVEQWCTPILNNTPE